MTTAAIAQLNALKVEDLSPRALHRLRILARFLMSRNYRFHGDGQEQIVQVLTAAKKQKDQEQLKGLVDWVEDYDKAAQIDRARRAPLQMQQRSRG